MLVLRKWEGGKRSDASASSVARGMAASVQ